MRRVEKRREDNYREKKGWDEKKRVER